MRHRLVIVILAAAATAGGCVVDQDGKPALTGPSVLAQSIIITANPDTLLLNGQQSVVVIQARDASGDPFPNLRMFLDILVGGVSAPCGRLSLGEVTTGSDGRTAAVFTAPTLPLPLPECSRLAGAANQVTITATPVGTNTQTLNPFGPSSASIRMLTPPVTSQVTVFTVNFTMSPSPAAALALVAFNGTGSVSPGHNIVSYQWNFGDGATKSGGSVTHDFGAAGTYTVTLTITDDIGQSGSKSALLTIF